MAKRKRGKVPAQTKPPASPEAKGQDSRNSVSDDNAAPSEVIRLEIPFEDKQIICARKGPNDKPQLICTHGAGGTIDSPGMTEFLQAFPTYVCFQGSMNMKSRVKYFHAAMEHFDAHEVLGGRSMGARAAVVTALETEQKPEALILASYPLVNGKGERQQAQREQILLDLPESIDVLFATGSEDDQCPLDILREVMSEMKARTWLLELKSADHGTTVKPKAGTQPMRAEIGKIATSWLDSRDDTKRYRAVAWDSDENCIVSQGWEGAGSSARKGSKKRKKA